MIISRYGANMFTRSQDYDIYPNCLSLEEHKYFE